MDKQANNQQTPLARGANSLDDQQQFAHLSQIKQTKAATGRRSFSQLLKGIKPLDISGESEMIEEGLPDDEAGEQPVITDLGPVRLRPSLPVLSKFMRARHLLAAGIAATIVLSLLTAGLIVLPRLTQSGPNVLLQAANLGNISLPAWGGKSAPNLSFITCVSSRPASSTVPQTPCTPLPVSHWQTDPNPYLSFVDNRGNLYTWTRGMQKPIKSISPRSGVFFGNSSLTWRWLYPGQYMLSSEQSPGSASVYQIWDTVQGRLLFTTGPGLPFEISDTGLIATLTPQHTVQILDAKMWLTPIKAQNISLFQVVTETLTSPAFAPAVAFSWSPDSLQLAIAMSDGSIQIWQWDAANTSVQLRQTLHILPVNVSDTLAFTNILMAWSPDGQRLAISASNRVGGVPIEIWDVPDSRLLRISGADLPAPTNMVWLANSQEMLASNAHQLWLWNTSKGQTIVGVQSITFLPTLLSPNMRLLAFPLTSSLRLIDAQTGKLLRTFQSSANKDYFVATAFSSDNRYLAALDTSGQIQVWNAQSGQQEMGYKLPGSFSQNGVSISTDLAWSPDNSMLAITSQSGLVVLGMPRLS